MWSCLTPILRLVAPGVGVRGVGVGELPPRRRYGGCSERDHQCNSQEKFLHWGLLQMLLAFDPKSPNRLANVVRSGRDHADHAIKISN
jgi:hypothetical protein